MCGNEAGSPVKAVEPSAGDSKHQRLIVLYNASTHRCFALYTAYTVALNVQSDASLVENVAQNVRFPTAGLSRLPHLAKSGETSVP